MPIRLFSLLLCIHKRTKICFPSDKGDTKYRICTIHFRLSRGWFIHSCNQKNGKKFITEKLGVKYYIIREMCKKKGEKEKMR